MSKTVIRYISAFLPPIIWAVVIYAFSSQQVLPGLQVSTVDFVSKKIAHMFVYAIFYILIFRGVSLTTHSSQQRTRFWLPLAICLVYAMADELHQTLVPNRTGTARDIGYDMIGAGIALLRTYQYI